MKQNRFVGIFFAGFLFLSFSWSLNMNAMESAFEDVEEDAAEAADKGADSAANTSSNVNSLTERTDQDVARGELQDLTADRSKITLTDSQEALLVKSNDANIENADKGLNKNKDFAPDDDGDVVPAGKDPADELRENEQAMGAARRTEKAINKMANKAADNVDQLARDFKGDPNLKSLGNKYLRTFNSIKEDIGKLTSKVGTDMGKDFATEMRDAVKSGNRKAVETLCVKISKLDAMSGLVDQIGSLEKDAESGMAGFEVQMQDSLEGSLDDLNKSFEGIEKDPESLLNDVDSGAKDAHGDIQKESMTSKFRKDLKSSVSDVVHKEILEITDQIDGKIESLSKDTGTLDKAFAKSKRFFSGHALEDTFESIKSTSITRDDIADGFCSVGRKLAKAGGKAVEILEEGAKMLISGVMFMIPNIFQSAFLAQKQRQSELQTLANPIKFGNWVFQIPDSCFNFANPSATLPIYVRIPVENVQDVVSLQMATQFKHDVSGPTTANPISAAIHSVGASIASFGGNLTARPKRYVTNEAGYLAQNPGIVLSYFTNNYPQWGSVALTSSQFSSGQIIDSNGFIIDGSGNQISATGLNGYDAYPLFTPLDWHVQNPPQITPDNMKDFYGAIGSRMALSGDDVKYVEYSTIGAGAAGATGSQALQASFDCSCLNQNNTVTCAIGSCVMNQIVQDYKSGCSFASDLLGSVQPLYGWGLTQGPILINQVKFPGYSGQSQATSFKVGKGNSETADYADPKTNHALLGCWVYLSANTPFAQAVRGNSKTQHSTAGSYVDYIIFLNEENEQVPLMVPIQKKYETSEVAKTASSKSLSPQSFGVYTVLGQNPDIKYWTSLASFDSNTSAPMEDFQDPQSGYALKYDLNGSAYADATLSGPKGVIGTAIADLQTFPGLAAQFATHQAAMAYKIQNGPFMYGNISLTLSDYNLTVPGSSGGAVQAVVPLYQGASCFGSFEDDLLVALDANNNYLTLPNVSVATFYSLITDVGYKVVNNSLVPSDFSQASMLQNLLTTPVTYSLVNTVATRKSYNVLDELLEASLESQYPLPSGTTSYISSALDAFVVEQRKKWAVNFDSSGQKQGITVGKLTCSLPSAFHTKSAVASNAFIYEIVPNPSAAFCDNDLFVLTSLTQPTLSSLVPMNAEDATASSTYAISLITGFVFDMQGNQVMSGSTPVRLQTPAPSASTMNGSMNKVQTITEQIYSAMTSKFDFAKFATKNFETKYHDWAQDYEVQMHRPMGPYSFGPLNVGIFAGDDAIGNYVYFPMQHMHEEDFEPSDVFVACQGTFPQLTMPVQFNEKTTYLMSLISGCLYDADSNIVSRLPSDAVLQQTDALIDAWGNWLKNTVTDLQEAMTQRLAAEQNEQTTLEAMLGSIQAPKYLLASTVKEIISGLTPGGIQGLAAPYGLLQYHPIKEIYVHLSPMSGNQSDGMLYMLFDIGTDKATNKRVGGVYTKEGQFVRLVKGLELEVMEKQFGVVVNSDGSQTLGIPLTQSFFDMKNPSEPLTLGKNSADGDLISSLSDQFPGGPVNMAKGFYLYFSMSMKTYYVYDAAQALWISCNGGHVYQKDGELVPAEQSVAVLQSTKSKRKSSAIAAADDMILLYENTNESEQGYMSDGQNYLNFDKNSRDTMSWTSLSSDSELSVTKNSSGTTYTIVDAAGSSKVYKVSSGVVWHSLFEVPINEKGVIQKSVNSSYRNAQLVVSGEKISHLLFHGVMYKISSKKGEKYLMVPVIATNKNHVTLIQGQDENTGAPYISVVDGEETYRYMYLMKSLNDDEQSYYRAKFAGTTSVATSSFPAGPVVAKTVTIGKQNVTVSVPKESTHVLFIKDIPNVTTLAAVPLSVVVDLPSGSELEIFTAKFTGNVLTSKDGRFFVAIAEYDSNNPATFSYVSNGAYVDLYTGVLFDTATGISLGYCLNLEDWISVLNNVGVSVMLMPNEVVAKSKSTGVSFKLRYRSANAVNVQTAQLVADEQANQQLQAFSAAISSLSDATA